MNICLRVICLLYNDYLSVFRKEAELTFRTVSIRDDRILIRKLTCLYGRE